MRIELRACPQSKVSAFEQSSYYRVAIPPNMRDLLARSRSRIWTRQAVSREQATGSLERGQTAAYLSRKRKQNG